MVEGDAVEDEGPDGPFFAHGAIEHKARRQLFIPQIEDRERGACWSPPDDAPRGSIDVTYEVETEIEDVGEEIGYGAIGFMAAEHIACNDAALLECIVPVFYAAIASEYGVEKLGDIPGRIDARQARLKVLVDNDTILQSQSAVTKKVDLGLSPRTDHREITGKDPPALGSHCANLPLASER